MPGPIVPVSEVGQRMGRDCPPEVVYNITVVTDRFTFPAAEAARFCQRWKIVELAVFGSALREDFDADSDVDLLVTFAPDADWSLLDHVKMQQELADVLRRPVDLVSRRAIENSHNPIRKREILTSARTVYAA